MDQIEVHMGETAEQGPACHPQIPDWFQAGADVTCKSSCASYGVQPFDVMFVFKLGVKKKRKKKPS
jgi:hypothetical protein